MSSGSGSLARYIVVRLLLVIPMMWVLLTVVFFLLRVAPGDPVSAVVGGRLSEEALDAASPRARHRPAADRPVPRVPRANVARFDFGTTISDNRQVIDVVRDQGGATLTLTIGAFLIALADRPPAGPPRRPLPRQRPATPASGSSASSPTPPRSSGSASCSCCSWSSSSPAGRPTTSRRPITKFTVPSARPTSCWSTRSSPATATAIADVLEHHVLPCLTLGLLLAGVIIRLVRINVIQAMKGDYVEAARARGIPERPVVRRHAFRNALVPVITVIGLQVALTLSGAVLTERTFNWPGLGTELVQYIELARLHRGPGAGHVLRPGRGDRQPGGGHHQRPGRPEGEVLMSARSSSRRSGTPRAWPRWILLGGVASSRSSS